MLEKILDTYSEDEFIILDSSFNDAIIGIDDVSMRVIYSYSKIIETLIKDMSREEAIEHFNFNIKGSYIGEKTPIFCMDDF